MEVNENGFLSGPEGAAHLFTMSRYSFSKFKHKSIVKIWPGQYHAIYRYDDGGVDPVILAKIKVINIALDDSGVSCQLLDCKTNELYKVGHVPSLACGYEVGVSIPQRVFVERTIREVGDRFSYGIATGILLTHRSNPEWGDPDLDFMIDWFVLKNKFTDEGAWCRAIESYERRVI